LGIFYGTSIAFFLPMLEPGTTEAHAPTREHGGGLGIGVGVLLALAVSGILMACRGGAEGASSADGKVATTLHLETFVLNLADPGSRSYARVGIDLGLNRPLGKGDNAPALGPIRDTIIGVIGQAKSDDLITTGGKAKLKDELLRALQQREPGLGVEDVYFTEFLIQR
jgi:flagellar basal body-associated protein FliL